MNDKGNNVNASVKPHSLCVGCSQFFQLPQFRQILDDNSKNLLSLTYRVSVREVQELGMKGCHFCSIISQGVCPAHSDHDLTQIPQFIAIISVAKAGNVHPQLSLDLRLKDADDKFIKQHSIDIIHGGTRNKRLEESKPPDAAWSISTGSDATLDLVRGWLQHCITEHKVCEEVRMKPVNRNQSGFPAYLVDIGPDTLRLSDFAARSDRPDYLTLSHRWGGSHIFRLTTNNLLSLLSKIPFASLPKTFRDAITITRRLGYQYLWIDSLCIIQDSKTHWQTESAIMGDIYRGSACTIAALGGIDGDSGCFKSRNPLCFQHCRLEANLAGQAMWVQPGSEGDLWNRTGKPTGRSRVEPLHERAWVMQERLLSPRTIYYGTFGLYWECVAAQATHYKPEMETVTPTAKRVINEICVRPVTGLLDTSYREFHKWWVNVVTIYNSCNLTYGTDKLVAISAIIKLLERNTGLHNIAGLWKETALSELLWMANNPSERPMDAYQAPTWSWASLNSPVGAGLQIFDYKFDWKAEILEMVSHQIAENGQISGAYLRVRAPMQMVRWEVVENGYKLLKGTNLPKKNSADDRISFLPDIHPDSKQELWALLFVRCTDATSWMKIGLVVTKKTGREKEHEQEWLRVGSFRQYDWASSSTTFLEDGEEEIAEIVII